jgi:hypothetical protein
MDDTKRGLYRKYFVQRLRAEDADKDLRLAYETPRGTVVEVFPREKHERCRYYVLDLDHDRHSRAALWGYLSSCEAEYPALAADLRKMLDGSPAPASPQATPTNPGKDAP